MLHDGADMVGSLKSSVERLTASMTYTDKPPTLSVSPATDFAQDELLAVLSEIWHDGWHEAHASLVPVTFSALRTKRVFMRRLREAWGSVLVASRGLNPVGFAITRKSELHAFFVTAAERGQGVSDILIEACMDRLALERVDAPWLICAKGNHRARGFYERHGWRVVREETNTIFEGGVSAVADVWRMELLNAK